MQARKLGLDMGHNYLLGNWQKGELRQDHDASRSSLATASGRFIGCSLTRKDYPGTNFNTFAAVHRATRDL